MIWALCEIEMSHRIWIDTRDKPGLLNAMMKAFNNKGTISFEGDLSQLYFDQIHGASTKETDVLKRATVRPQLDFITVPLTDETINTIWQELIRKDHLVHEGIIHVQIESGGKMAFGGYDNFHKECVVAYEAVPLEIITSLKQNGVIREYKIASA